MTIEVIEDSYIDAFGIPLAVGDTVLHFFNQASSIPTICLATVVGRTSKRIRIEISETRQNGHATPQFNEVKLTKPETLVKHIPTTTLMLT